MKVILTLIFLLINYLSYSQINEIVYGKEYLSNRKDAFNGFIGENNLALYAVDYAYVSKKKHELIIRKYYKKDLSLIESIDLYSNPLENFYNTPLEIFYTQNKFYLFSQFDNHKTNTTKIGLFIFNEELKKISFNIIDTVEKISITDIEIKLAKDQTSFLILQSHQHKVANRQVLDLKTINFKGETVWQKELLSTNSVHNIRVEKIIHLKNETYILCNYGYKSYGSNNSDTPTTLTNKYTLWVYNHNLNFMKELVLRLKSKWINGVDITLNSANNLIVAGYVNSSRDFGINAVFNVMLNQKYEPKKVNYLKFSKKDYNRFLTDKQIEKQTYLKNFFLKDVIAKKDGSFYIIGEEYYKYVDRNYDPRTNMTTTTDHYNYNSILVSYFSSNGKLQWHERVAKFQNSTNDFGYYSSFSWINTPNGIAIVYNDNEKNTPLKITDYFNYKSLFNNRRNVHICVTFNSNGVLKKQQLNTNKTNYLLYSKQSFAINNNRLYLKLAYGRYSKIMSVSFK